MSRILPDGLDRRLPALAAAVAVLFTASIGIVATRGTESVKAVAAPAHLSRAEPDIPMLEPPPPPPPPSTTTTTVYTVTGRRSGGTGVSVPKDPYAPEPIRQIGMIEIPKIGLVHSIWEGVTLNNINNGPSHWPGTALPGDPGNTVFAGHRVTHDHPFRRIDELVPGDWVVFTVNGRRSAYRVTGHDVVSPKDTWIANQTQDATGTLFACHPPGTKTFRYVVHLALVANG